MSNPIEEIQKAFTEEKLDEIINNAWKEFLVFEEGRSPDQKEFFDALRTSDFFASMYNVAYRTGIITGVKLLEQALKK